MTNLILSPGLYVYIAPDDYNTGLKIGQDPAIIMNSSPFLFIHPLQLSGLLLGRVQAVIVVIDLDFGAGLSTGSLVCEIFELGQINESLCVSVFSSVKWR